MTNPKNDGYDAQRIAEAEAKRERKRNDRKTQAFNIAFGRGDV